MATLIKIVDCPEGCGQQAEILEYGGKRQGQYFCKCPKCGTDQRNTATTQAKWKRLIDGEEVAPAEEISRLNDKSALPAIEQPTSKPGPESNPPNKTGFFAMICGLFAAGGYMIYRAGRMA